MSLCVNPQKIIVRVLVNGGYIVLDLKSPTSEQTRKVRKSAAKLEVKRNKPEWKDEQDETILEVIEDLLINASALDENEQPTELTYFDQDSEEEKLLNNQVENWKNKIGEHIKLVAGRELFKVEAEVGEDVLKN